MPSRQVFQPLFAWKRCVLQVDVICRVQGNVASACPSTSCRAGHKCRAHVKVSIQKWGRGRVPSMCKVG
eukprot:2755784-Pleurochrysis_carterae.AAC.3